jgi:glycerol-3-phosphate acyltransferase PlsY
MGLLAVLLSYLCGSLPTGYLIVRWLARIDVRSVGSGNVGATNVTRAAGKGAGALVFALDVAKGLVAVLWLATLPGSPPARAMQLTCGLAAILGHNFPVTLGFRGGKGVATTIGVLFATMPLIALAGLGVWVACFLMWRYVSAASLAAAVAVPLIQLATRAPAVDAVFGVTLALLIIARHHANIRRLLQGTEHRVGGQKSTGS